MSSNDHQRHAEPSSPTRPGSAWTNSSLFADSAISLRTGTPGPLDKGLTSSPTPETSTTPRLADHLNGLVSEIWANEQDGTIRGDKRRKLKTLIDEIEAVLEDDSVSSEESDVEPAPLGRPPLPAQPPTESHPELESIRSSLASTVEAMRMRQHEQRHLHQLTTEKLEAVAQRCIQQEKRLREFAEEMVRLKQENRHLSQENESLNKQLDQAYTEAANKEVAVSAMSSAVAGLEGWINGSPTPNRPSRRVVTRGRGRFRGRYYVDEPSEGPTGYGLDSASDAKTLHEGVTAWLRGFRDVEEELKSSERAKMSRWKEPEDAPDDRADDWGEFESAPGR